MAAFATFAVAFIARPVGAAGFGHYDDRIGRKRTLISTLLLKGIATVLIELLPGAAKIGIAAPILLVVLRFAQGLALLSLFCTAALPETRNRDLRQAQPSVAASGKSRQARTSGCADRRHLDQGRRRDIYAPAAAPAVSTEIGCRSIRTSCNELSNEISIEYVLIRHLGRRRGI